MIEGVPVEIRARYIPNKIQNYIILQREFNCVRFEVLMAL
jgi:hypothetical protein